MVLLSAGFVNAQCNLPTGGYANNFTSWSVTLYWTAATGATGYEYVVDQNTADPTGSGTFTGSAYVSVMGLSSGTSYVGHIRTVCNQGFSGWVSIPFTTLVSNCPALTGLNASGVTAYDATLSWDPVTSAGYEYVLDQNSSDPMVFGSFSSSEIVSLSSLQPSTTYFFHVRNNCGNSDYSPWTTTTFTTQPGIGTCNVPTGISAFAITMNSAYITWNATTGAIGYEYVVDQLSTDPIGSGTLTSSTSYNYTGLSAGTVYYLHVRTKCSNTSFSPWGIYSFTTMPPICFSPSTISASNITNTTADINWPAVNGVTDYEYLIQTSSATPSIPGTNTTALTASFNGLSAGNTYYAFVRSVCGNNNYSNWMYVSFTTTGTTNCQVTSNLTASNITSSSADFNWTAITGAIGYEYVIDFSPGTPLTPGTAVSTNTVSINSLADNTTFYMHVRTQCSGLDFSDWIDIPFTTLPLGPCNAPVPVSASGITTASANLSWPAINGAMGYEYAVTTSSVPPVSGTFTTGLSYVANSLNAGTTYYAHIRTDCGSAYSTWVTQPFTTLTTISCNAPLALTVSNITSVSATGTWAAVTGATGYEYVTDQSSAAPTGSGTGITTASVNMNALTAGTNYYLHVRSQCANNTFSPWTTQSFATVVTTGVWSVNQAATVIDVFPNPARDIITIRTNSTFAGTINMLITDLNGKIVKRINVLSDKTIVDIKDIASGMYFIKYTDSEKSNVIQFVKQ